MKLNNGKPHRLISIAAAGACAIAFSGCLPSPPTTLALFYQIAPTANEEQSWIKRWVPATGDTEVLLQQQADTNGLNVELLTDPQPSGAVISLVRYHPPSTFWSVLVADNPTPAPRLLYTQTAHDDGTITGGRWLDWSPDGKRVAMQINRTVWLSQADGVFRYPIGTADIEDYPVATLHAWSPDSSTLAYTREDAIFDIYEANTGERWDLTLEDKDGDFEPGPFFVDGPLWNYESTEFLVRIYEQNKFYTAAFYKPTPAPLVEDTSMPAAAAAIVNSSPDLRYFVQADDNGDGTFVNALLFDTQTPDAPGTPLPDYRKIAWAPDSGHLALITDEAEASECSVSVVKTSADPRTVTLVAENTSCLAFWSVPQTP